MTSDDFCLSHSEVLEGHLLTFSRYPIGVPKGQTLGRDGSLHFKHDVPVTFPSWGLLSWLTPRVCPVFL